MKKNIVKHVVYILTSFLVAMPGITVFLAIAKEEVLFNILVVTQVVIFFITISWFIFGAIFKNMKMNIIKKILNFSDYLDVKWSKY